MLGLVLLCVVCSAPRHLVLAWGVGVDSTSWVSSRHQEQPSPSTAWVSSRHQKQQQSWEARIVDLLLDPAEGGAKSADVEWTVSGHDIPESPRGDQTKGRLNWVGHSSNFRRAANVGAWVGL